MENQYAIQMLNITKKFPGIIANDNITLQLRKGEIHALLGENGAGKSTLMSVLFGLYQPEEGEIHKDGRKVEIKDPNDANALGIGMVHQHFKLVECFSVLDNIILGVEPNNHGFLQKQDARKKVMELSEKYGLIVNPDALICDLSVGEQQRVEILKALYRNVELLILDEPTSGLDPIVRDEILDVFLDFVQDENHSILISSHITSDLEKVADYITFLHEGKIIMSKEKDELIEQYGILRCKESTYQELNRNEMIAYKKEDYQWNVLVKNRRKLMQTMKDAVIDKPTIDEIMLLCVKGERV